MKSFIGSLHGTSRSGSSSSTGGCSAIYQTLYARRRSSAKAYLAGCDVHDKVHRGEIARERESIFDELKNGETRRPYIRANSVFPPCDAFGLGGSQT